MGLQLGHTQKGKTKMLHTQITLFRDLRVSALISTGLLVGLVGLFIFPTANMEETKATNTTSETTLAMTTADVNLAFNVTNPNGTFSASEPAEFTVTSNNYSGYTLSIGAKEDNANNSKLIYDTYAFNSISAASGENDFTNGVWGYKPSKINSTANNDYLPAPSYAGDTLDITNSANNEANSYSIALAAKADYSLPAGIYANTFVITAVANPVGYQITYDANTEDAVTDLPVTQTGDVTVTDIEISNNTPARIGYTFNGWCDGTVANTDGIDSCGDNIYQPGDIYDATQTMQNVLSLTALWSRSFTINYDANNGIGNMEPQTIIGNSDTLAANTFTRISYLFYGWNTEPDGTGTDFTDGDTFNVPAAGTNITLYAKWHATFASAFAGAGKTKVTINGNEYYQMQDMNSSICSIVSLSSESDFSDTEEAQLVDIRDNKIYWVVKALDGHCWMTQNLDHDIVTTANYYTPSNTDIAAAWTPVTATDTLANWMDYYDAPSSFDPGDWYYTDTWYASYNVCISDPYDYIGCNYLNNLANGKFDQTPFVGNGSHGHVGNYYNWSAAVATNDTSSITSDGATVNTSICPAGWRLPTTQGTNEFAGLLNAYNANNDSGSERDKELLSAPLYFVRAGGIWGKGLRSAGRDGLYWSNTNNSGTHAYFLGFNSETIDTAQLSSRHGGWSVRCIAR